MVFLCSDQISCIFCAEKLYNVYTYMQAQIKYICARFKISLDGN